MLLSSRRLIVVHGRSTALALFHRHRPSSVTWKGMVSRTSVWVDSSPHSRIKRKITPMNSRDDRFLPLSDENHIERLERTCVDTECDVRMILLVSPLFVDRGRGERS